ncbi:MAG: 30S ribosomal protein THX [Bacteroidia bacterium]|jgi:30S ribosomal protein S31|nr:30S ribosomal protein THX [Bacteroidales bacterium]NCD40652.1 30S ribosomal protein THX [Bacteroidia bacterium]MDD2322512.1 30S ribosomal protein THX [Bacteroidales bacterium]MDD3009940.1 30S ribosomal protein THX [Bacteroidales bacterium]MDD3960470.1 30S ribosomal protein THX [Bacteroidales bacterium]
MGKGDIKTKRGKIVNGSYGKSRPKKEKNVKALKELLDHTKDQAS